MERAMAEISLVLRGQTIPTSVYSLVARDGTVKHGEISGAPILRNGDIVGMVSVVRDITKRIQAETALHRQQERLDLAQSAGRVGVFDWDMVSGRSTWTPQLEIIYGIEPGSVEHTSADWAMWIHPDDREKAESRVRRCIREKLPEIAGDYRILRPDGEVRWLSNQATIFYDASAKPVRMVGTSADITERKRVEEELRESERKYRELYDFLPIPVYEMDWQANVTSANRAIYEIFGGREEDLKAGFNAWNLLSPENIEKSGSNIQRLLQGEKIEGTEYTVKRLDGSVFNAIVISSVIYDHDKPVGLRGAIVDITERKQTEEKLRASEYRYRLLVENANEAIMVVQDGMVRFVNNKALESYGYSEKEFLAIPLFELVHPDDREQVAKRYLQKIKGDATPTRHTFRTLHKNGRIIWIAISSVLIEWEGRPATLNLIVDITEQKRAEEMLLNTTERLRRSLAGTVQAISMAVEIKDPYTSGHQKRTADLARAIATEMGFSTDRTDFVRVAGSIHDIGKISVPAEILSKPTRLRNLEYELIKSHARAGYDILKDIEFSWPVADVVLQHHERMDGSGYPQGLKGNAILLEARILAVADVVEAIASHRPYRPALGMEVAIEEIKKNRGILYDPEVTDACLRLLQEKRYRLN
jgi:PAS domain S-box-containing protein/putative nucleotidyltransferase with HDIG domain